MAKLELHDLKTDVGEKHDAAAKHPEVAKRIEKVLDMGRVPSKVFPLKALDGR